MFNKKIMKKNYYLKNCTTCQRIIASLPNTDDMIFQNIKTEPITTQQLEEMHKLSGSYESLFSKRAMLYKERNLKERKLTENDYKNLILEHYTFLKRPVFVINDKIFIGNSPKNIEALVLELSK